MRKNRDLTENVRLLDNRLLAEMLCVSQSQLFALRQAGRVPLKPIRLGGSVRYDRRQAEQWIEAGCPVDWRAGR
ncbi:MAG TPA: hypothetical protein P5279_13255 [Anaerohalosphaeraceae bacterium]|jgi:predicted DNA-binding transcriptional regulator AlpA|nr:hypothetical protein [Anaerohalosphaeraceae bacterium]HRT51457.1 hypothetical protein [Anaerohalosphaeraceae bacterium]HRT87504.1 hypothetical protein [Anaerohalosphaeraceae bacterium]